MTTTLPEPALALSRAALLDILVRELERSGVPWAWQGRAGAPQAWARATGASDLDVWWNPPAHQRAALERRLAHALGAAVVSRTHDAGRLMHTGLAVECAGGLAHVDLTCRDLRVGAVLLVPAEDVRVAQTPTGPRLQGVAASADLLLRPLLRGRVPEQERIAEAQAAWSVAAPAERRRAVRLWRHELGAVVDQVVRALEGGRVAEALVPRLRRRLLRQTLRPGARAAAWKQRRTIRPAGRRAGPLGLPTRGVVVALVGTDGSGKSTVSDELRRRLSSAGFDTVDAYFGMARGNLPGVARARRLLGVASSAEPAANGAADDSRSAPSPAATGSLQWPTLRRMAAWFYAAEYVWRYLTLVSPHRRQNRVVVCDRYVYDLEHTPWPGSRAAAWVRAVVPAPDLLVLPDAPIEMIHRRKPERPLEEQAAQQEWLRAVLASRPARVEELVVDTSGASPDPVGSLMTAVVEVAHGCR